MVWTKIKSWFEDRFANSESKHDEETKTWISLFEFVERHPGGDVSMVRPDETVQPPFDGGKSIIDPWGIAVDGDDNVWDNP